MNQPHTHNGNAEQAQYWNGEAGETWVERNNEMDTMMRPLGATAIERADVTTGEHVLDIGCGCGGTTLDLSACVGSTGLVLGVDISKPMLSFAKHRIQELPENLRRVPSFQLADATDFDFPEGSFDLLFSRCGVMFFSDPTAAFTNLRKALKVGGRLTFLCWGPLSENDWFMTPLMAARPHLPPSTSTTPDPRAPGAFALSDTQYVTDILSTAGFKRIHFEATSPIMKVGREQSLDETTEFFMELPPISRALTDQPDSLRTRVKEAITETITDRYRDGFVNMGAKCWIVTAENGAK